MNTYFVNEAFENGIKDYLNSKDNPEGIIYNSFLVVVIRMFINIYGELDIINPYIVKNEEALYTNLMKYGDKKEQIVQIFNLIQSFYNCSEDSILLKEKCCFFVEIQKRIIDLFNSKRINYDVSEDDTREFFDLLYTPGTSNALRMSYNYLNAENIYEVAEYYKNSMKVQVEEKKEDKKELLGFDIYNYFNYSIADLSKMNSDDIRNLNKKIYKSLDINENSINKEYLLKEKVKELMNKHEPITTGNGYVDILLIMSIIVTVVMVIFIFITFVF